MSLMSYTTGLGWAGAMWTHSTGLWMQERCMQNQIRTGRQQCKPHSVWHPCWLHELSLWLCWQRSSLAWTAATTDIHLTITNTHNTDHTHTDRQTTHSEVGLSWEEFNISLDTLQDISETIFPANHLTGAKHSAFSTNHLSDIDILNTNARKNTKTKQLCKKTIKIYSTLTKENETKAWFSSPTLYDIWPGKQIWPILQLKGLYGATTQLTFPEHTYTHTLTILQLVFLLRTSQS